MLEAEFPRREHADSSSRRRRTVRAAAEEESDDGRATVTFEVDLSQDVDLPALKGKKLTATLVSDNGQSETTFSA